MFERGNKLLRSWAAAQQNKLLSMGFRKWREDYDRYGGLFG